MRRYWFLIAWRVLCEGVLNFFGFCVFRAALRPQSKRKCVAFQAYSVHLAQFFTPVILKLRQEMPALDIHFIVLPHPHFSWRSLQALRGFAREHLQIPESHIHYFWEILWHQYDFIVCTDVYARFPLRHTQKVFLNHGPGIAQRLLQPHPFRKTLLDFDLVLVAGEEDRDLLRRSCPTEFVDDKVKTVGLPYLDRLRTCVGTRVAYLQGLGLDPDRPVVLLAPSWRGLQELQAYEPGCFEALIATFRALDVNLLIKLHACSFNKVMTQGMDWAKILDRYVGGNIRLDDNVDDVPALQHADVLITDISSRSYNFMLLDKPVILLIPVDLFPEPLDRERIALMQQAAVTARSVAEVQALVANGLPSHPDGGRNRLRVARRCFANPGRATQAVVAHLLG